MTTGRINQVCTIATTVCEKCEDTATLTPTWLKSDTLVAYRNVRWFNHTPWVMEHLATHHLLQDIYGNYTMGQSSNTGSPINRPNAARSYNATLHHTAANWQSQHHNINTSMNGIEWCALVAHCAKHAH